MVPLSLQYTLLVTNIQICFIEALYLLADIRLLNAMNNAMAIWKGNTILFVVVTYKY